MDKQELCNKINELYASLEEIDVSVSKKITEIDKQLKELKEELAEQPQENKRWRAREGGFYYFADDMGDIQQGIETFSYNNDRRFDRGNYFISEQEGKEEELNRCFKKQLENLAMRLNKGIEIDWNDFHQGKNYLYLKNSTKELGCCYTYCVQYAGTVYCLDENFLDIAKKEIGEDNLIQLIKSGI